MLIVYDIETLANCFTLTAIDENDNVYVFVICPWRNDYSALCTWLDDIVAQKHIMVGFNNLAFDHPVLFHIYANACRDAEAIYKFAQRTIANAKTGYRAELPHVIIPQIDLLKVHHYDNKAKMTGLKQLEFVMRLEQVMEMPIHHATPITPEQLPAVLVYNLHDVKATREFLNWSATALELRRELCSVYNSSAFMNYSNAKLGKEIVIRELKKAGIQCYNKDKSPRQTPRPDGVPVSHILLPEIHFKSRAFNSILTDFKRLVIRETKGVNLNLSVNVRGVDFDFGFGGIHASVKKKVYRSSDTHVIMDADVTSYYPNMSIKHGFYPAHLGAGFGPVYEALFFKRAEHKKAGNKALSDALKEALNCVYGNSNEINSPFYDPKMTMGITINGQLLLAMLCERLLWYPEFEIIQANTDGVTFLIPRVMLPIYQDICEQWQKETQLSLEFAEYKSMFVRDVNNYIAEPVSGKLKLKGAYVTAPDWHKDHSFLIVKKAAVAKLVENKPIAETIKTHTDIFDFLGFLKVNKSSKIRLDKTEYSGSLRYAITRTGHQLFKIMPPDNKDSKKAQFLRAQGDVFGTPPAQDREFRIQAGRLCTGVNDVNTAIVDLDYDFYIKEAEKLTRVFENEA